MSNYVKESQYLLKRCEAVRKRHMSIAWNNNETNYDDWKMGKKLARLNFDRCMNHQLPLSDLNEKKIM